MIDLEKKYSITLRDLILTILLSTLAGAVLAVLVPVLIYTIALGFIIYIALSVYYRVKGSEAQGP